MTQPMLAFITSCVAEEEGAIHVYRLDVPSGRLEEINDTTQVEYPFFLAIHPQRNVLYSIHRAGPYGQDADGEAIAFAIDRTTGGLTYLNCRSTRGTLPTYLDVDPTGRSLLVANFMGGSVATLPIGDDGRLGEATSFIQYERASGDECLHENPYTHSFVIDPAGQYAICASLGHDKIYIYQLDAATGSLTPQEQPFVRMGHGTGPRHFTFHPSAQFAYVINETCGSVTGFRYDAERGLLFEIQTISTLPQGYAGKNFTADIKVTPHGKFLYGTNRGHNSIAIYQIDESTGRLSLVDIVPSLGKNPQYLAITPDSSLLLCANEESHQVVTFQIDDKTGNLEATGEQIDLNSPTCIMLLSAS